MMSSIQNKPYPFTALHNEDLQHHIQVLWTLYHTKRWAELTNELLMKMQIITLDSSKSILLHELQACIHQKEHVYNYKFPEERQTTLRNIIKHYAAITANKEYNQEVWVLFHPAHTTHTQMASIHQSIENVIREENRLFDELLQSSFVISDWIPSTCLK